MWDSFGSAHSSARGGAPHWCSQKHCPADWRASLEALDSPAGGLNLGRRHQAPSTALVAGPGKIHAATFDFVVAAFIQPVAGYGMGNAGERIGAGPRGTRAFATPEASASLAGILYGASLHPRGAVLVALGGGCIACACSQKLLGPRSAPQAHGRSRCGPHDLLTAVMPSGSHPLRNALALRNLGCSGHALSLPALWRCVVQAARAGLAMHAACTECDHFALRRTFRNRWLRADLPQSLPRRVRKDDAIGVPLHNAYVRHRLL